MKLHGKLLFVDYKTGFGGKFGVQKDRQDKSAVGYDDHEKLAAHESQKGVLFKFVYLLIVKSECEHSS